MSAMRAGPWSRRRLLTSAATTAAVLPFRWRPPADGRPPEHEDTPAGAVARLLAGNRRFVDGRPRAPRHQRARRSETVQRQAPFAAVLGCSDSRVPHEIVFDQGFGDLFVVRLAGNVATSESVASLEFAAALLDVRAIVVLGHTRCGAVDAVLATRPADGRVGILHQHIAPGLDASRHDLVRAVEDNARAQRRKLLAESPVLADRVARQTLAVEAAVYDLSAGTVRVLT